MRRFVRHGGVDLAVRHSGHPDRGTPLLLLHALGGSSADWAGVESAWPGPVTALDFCGHGDSDWLPGRGYYPEVFVADADAVLAEIDDGRGVHVAGAGVGAYVALLLAGSRPAAVRAALLWPGEGLAGGAAVPHDLDPHHQAEWLAETSTPDRAAGEPGPDPLVRRCARDVRPTDYAEAFAKAAGPLAIAAVDPTPPWLAAAAQHGRSEVAPPDLHDALARLAAL